MNHNIPTLDTFLFEAGEISSMLIRTQRKQKSVYEKSDEMLLIETLSISRDVMIDRLKEYTEDLLYEEYANDTNYTALFNSIKAQLRDTALTHFPNQKSAAISVLNLLVLPILAIATKQILPHDRSKVLEVVDSINDIISYITDSDIISNDLDAEIALRVLSKKNTKSITLH